jgi:cobalamin biosynthesis protein CobW
VTGFLGAGKTTLLRHLLRQRSHRLAILVNEFGEVGIDGALLKACGICDAKAPPIVELANGCLCCSVQDEFLPTMEKLLDGEHQFDAIVIETSGLALPEPLLQAFNWPSIRHRTRVSGVVTVVDGEALSGGSVVIDKSSLERQRQADPSLDHVEAIEDLFREQLEVADLVLISRADLLTAEQLEAARQTLSREQQLARPGAEAPSLAIAAGVVEPDLLLGLDRPELSSNAAGSADEHHDHSHPELTAASISLQGHWPAEGLEQLFSSVISELGLLRLKGRLPIAGKALPMQVQAVGKRLQCWYEADGLPADHLALVLIGAAAEPTVLEAQLMARRTN